MKIGHVYPAHGPRSSDLELSNLYSRSTAPYSTIDNRW